MSVELRMDNEIFHSLPKSHGLEVLRVQVGSGVHGVTVAGTDDRDEMGICVERPECVIGLRRFEQWEYRTKPQGVRSGHGDLDLTVYSLRKWTRLALAGNPSILLPLFVPSKDVMIEIGAGADIRNHPERFLSRHTASRFLGYMQAQREQMMGLRGKKHTNRPELVAQFGYDTKFAYHMIRLGLQGVELLETGRITLPVPEMYRRALIDVREGRWAIADTIDWATSLESELVRLRRESNLPADPDHERVNRWLIEQYQNVWEVMRYC